MLLGMRLAELKWMISKLARDGLAESWDNVGLLLGDLDQSIRRGMLCIDLTEPVLAEAVQQKADLIVAYHPPIFQPLKSLTTKTWKGRVILEAARRRIAIYSPHTALDKARDGLTDWLVNGIGKGDVFSMRCADMSEEERVAACSPENTFYNPHKIVTFVPPEHVDRVRDAMAQAGAGNIGHYRKCSFTTPGEGTFEGDETTKPAVGQKQRFERVGEVRLEMVVWPMFATDALKALKKAHPYEEPAIDLYEMIDARPLITDADRRVGAGRVVDLDRPITPGTLVSRVKRLLGVRQLELNAPRGRKRIRRVGVCPGAGGSLLEKWQGPMDAYLTGEMRHHDVLDAVQRGIVVILAGHTNTERPYLKVYRHRLAKATGGAVRWTVSRRDKAPGVVV
jgi:dinuclear metal center YbgI/SA1388 family protein